MQCVLTGIIAMAIILFYADSMSFSAKPPVSSDEVRAIYLASAHLFNEKKIKELENIIIKTNINAIVIDFKDSNSPPYERLKNLVNRFKKHNAYLIARIVTFQDSSFARRHPEIAIKHSDGSLWYSGRKKWNRYWLDPASPLAQNYNIEIAKRAIDCGFDEIQFDYIRFPTDGNMKDIRYPFFNSSQQTKREVMAGFFKKIHTELKNYSPQTAIAIDVFGEVFVYGKEPGIGQYLEDVAKYFDVLCPMAYPSHFQCGMFGLKDPTANPYKVYYVTLKNGLNFLKNQKVIIRPWIQDFTLASIYGCGPTVIYDKDKILDQIKAGQDLGIRGFMLWNAGSNFTVDALK